MVLYSLFSASYSTDEIIDILQTCLVSGVDGVDLLAQKKIINVDFRLETWQRKKHFASFWLICIIMHA